MPHADVIPPWAPRGQPRGYGSTSRRFYGPAGRLATAYWRNPATCKLEERRRRRCLAEAPAFEADGVGRVSTVDDFLAFGRMLLGGGAYRGRQLLSGGDRRRDAD